MQFALGIFIALTIALVVIVIFLLDIIATQETRIDEYRRKELRNRIIDKHTKELKRKYPNMATDNVINALAQMKARNSDG